MTLKQRYIEGLKVLGYRIVPKLARETGHTTTMYNPIRIGPTIFVGMRGIVRQSPTGRLCDSAPLEDSTKQAILRNAKRSVSTKVSTTSKLIRRERKKLNR